MDKITKKPTVDNNLEITLPKNARETYRIALERYHGVPCIDARVWYLDDDSGELKPTRKGLAISLENWPSVRAALAQFDKDLHAAGLLVAGDVDEGEDGGET